MRYLFLAIIPPAEILNSAYIVELARQAASDNDQARPCGGSARISAVASISPICLSIASTRRSKCGLLGLIHFPYACVAFSRMTGIPAIERLRTALFAIVAAATVSTYQAISSSVTAKFPNLKTLFCRESEKGRKP